MINSLFLYINDKKIWIFTLFVYKNMIKCLHIMKEEKGSEKKDCMAFGQRDAFIGCGIWRLR